MAGHDAARGTRIGENGKILSEGFAGPSNYHTAGLEMAEESIKSAASAALAAAGIGLKDLDFTVLGLSSADRPEDFAVLNPIAEEIFGSRKFKILNDTWIALKTGSPDYWGIVAICGTGGGFAGRDKSGKEVILRNLDYVTGNRGGGSELAETALHFAFRSEEGTYTKSLLETEIPKLFGQELIGDLIADLWVRLLPEEGLQKIPPLLFELANQGDTVSVEILQEHGKALGEFISGIIQRLSMQGETVPVVLAGSVYKGNHPALLDELKAEVRKTAPKAQFNQPLEKPASGAYAIARSRIYG